MLIREVKPKEAMIKAVIWRVFIAVPMSFMIVYIFFGNFYKSLELTIVANLIMTILHYIYELFWDKVWTKIERKS